MNSTLLYIVTFAAGLYACPLAAQRYDVAAQRPLSAAEGRADDYSTDIGRMALRRLHSQPASTHWHHLADTTLRPTGGIVYGGIDGSSSNGDFLSFEGDGATNWRFGACGETFLGRYGTLSGRLQYARGKHRRIGWSAMRQPDLYLPYISTDSIGGDFRYDSYQATGRYGFTLGSVALAAELDFEGEQAHRLSDPRALINNTWLRPSLGAAVETGSVLLMASAGYGRNKQHVQLRYWRPGEQDRFFVAYGFGLYDTRQSGVTFGKARMYYIDEWRAGFTTSSANGRSSATTANGSSSASSSNGRSSSINGNGHHFATAPLSWQAGVDYTFRHMSTEESDIYNLYESRTHRLEPHARLTWTPRPAWALELWGSCAAEWRKGYENIIEEYLIDDQNNIYDFRTLDTQQNYERNNYSALGALRLAHAVGTVDIGLQGGVRWLDYEEKYRHGRYSISVTRWLPHARIDVGSCDLAKRKNATKKYSSSHSQSGQPLEGIADATLSGPQAPAGRTNAWHLALQYTWQRTAHHRYDVDLSSSTISQLDFQHAFAPYAWRTADTGTLSLEAAWEHRFGSFDAGLLLRGFVTTGHRKHDVAYHGTVGFASTAPILSTAPDSHNERYGSLTAFLRF